MVMSYYTAWKVSLLGVFWSVHLRLQLEYRTIPTRKTPNTDAFLCSVTVLARKLIKRDANYFCKRLRKRSLFHLIGVDILRKATIST